MVSSQALCYHHRAHVVICSARYLVKLHEDGFTQQQVEDAMRKMPFVSSLPAPLCS